MTSRFSKAVSTTALVLSVALTASAQTIPPCSTGGGGGAVPTSGTGDGTFPGTLPSAPLTTTISATATPGSTCVTSVTLRGMSHTYVTDLQFVLGDPAGNKYNLFCRPGLPTVVYSCDYGGDYTIVAPCTTGMAQPGSCTSPTIYPPGTYDQFFGTWPSGTHSITNTSLSAIPAVTGTWSLTIYDWAGADIGTLTSFEICFGTPPPSSPPSVPVQTLPANGSVVSSPTNLTWNAAACATTYDVEVDGNVTTGIGATNFSFSGAPGTHSWRVRGVNGAGISAWSGIWTFDFPTPPPPSVCVSGGAGGAIPTSGTGGTGAAWPGTLPSAQLDAPLNVASLPAGATKIVRVKLNGLSHTWVGDLQFVLETPTGGKHNLVHRPAFTGTGFGNACDLGGDYSIYQSSGTGDWLTCPTSPIPSGNFNQEFGSGGGAWPNGTNGINNTLLGSIPIAAGVWVLHVYDWAGGDIGSLTSWELCFDVPSGPVAYCTAGTSTNGCVPSIGANAQPSASLSTSCTITVMNVEGQKSGLIFYGLMKLTPPVSWGIGSNSYLCIKAPTQRMITQSSGGAINTCTGTLTQSWNAFQTANPTSLGNPFAAGNSVFCQGWYRDPPAVKTTNLTDGLELTVVP